MPNDRYILLFVLSASIVGIGFQKTVQAEPYIALRTGLACSQCHTDPTGGGQRTTFAYQWAQTNLTDPDFWQQNESLSGLQAWQGEVSKYLRAGGNIRTGFHHTDLPESEDSRRFQSERTLLYLNFSLIPGKLNIYADEKLGPGGAANRQAFAMVRFDRTPIYLKAGRLFLPFGWRLEDDNALTRSATGINFNSADDGIEAGFLGQQWQGQLTITNGEGGAGENDKGKQISTRIVRMLPSWRIGASLNHNEDQVSDREMANLFAGFRTGDIVWLAELDWINDEADSGERQISRILLVEANAWLKQGHNLKATVEKMESSIENDNRRSRYSFIWEWFPMPYGQLRIGARVLDDDNGIELFDNEDYFGEINVYF